MEDGFIIHCLLMLTGAVCGALVSLIVYIYLFQKKVATDSNAGLQSEVTELRKEVDMLKLFRAGTEEKLNNICDSVKRIEGFIAAWITQHGQKGPL